MIGAGTPLPRSGHPSLNVVSVSVPQIRLRQDIAYEYLDDGGLLACQLEEGEFWQLGAPAGRLWELIVDLADFEQVVAAMGVELQISAEEAQAGLEALCESLQVMGLVSEWSARPSA